MSMYEGIDLGGYYESMADPAENRLALQSERDEEAYTVEMREGVVDAIQSLREALGDADHDYPGQETCDARLLVLKVIATLEEI